MGAAILAPSWVVLRCEIKPDAELRPYPGLLDQALAILGRQGLLGRTVITSFHLPTCGEAARSPVPLREVIWLVADQVAHLTSPGHVARLAAAEEVGAVALRHRALGGEAIERVLRLGLPVSTTDRPDAALRLRAALTA